MYEYLALHRDTLKYVVVCAGKEDLNHEIACDMVDYFNRYSCSVGVYSCSRKGVEAYAADGTVSSSHNLYRVELLCDERLDQMAMVINHQYQASSDKTALEHWMECDYFSRRSCRASADFMPAMLRAASKTAEQVLSGEWSLSETQKENLSKTEHLRWCAFHYCMGFSSMTDEEYEQRSRLYLQEIAENGSSSLRIGKNMKAHTHACLVGWDELKTLSDKEAAVTGKYRDYQALDTDNVMLIPRLIAAKEDMYASR